MMTPERWQQVKEIFDAALERDPAQRVTFLDQACMGDTALRQEVDSLLAMHSSSSNVLDNTVGAMAARLLSEDKSESLVGQTIGAYRVEREIGRGGMGEVYLALIHAAVELRRGNADRAVELLEAATRYDGAVGWWPTYLRGQAYLRLNQGGAAAAEFQKIIDHPGWGPYSYSIFYAPAHLGLARAAALAGDGAKSRKAYQDFFAQWKDADPGIPILVEAKKEYEKLK